jgi:hypothetical protein
MHGMNLHSISQDERLRRLRGRIGWICQTIRFCVVLFVVADLAAMISFLTDHEAVERHYAALLRIDVAGASSGQYAAALAIGLIVWLFVAAVCVCLWQVFTLYLKGGVFSVEAARWLRRAGLIGLATLLLDVVARSAIILSLAAHLPPGQSHHGYVRLQDLLNIIFMLMLVAIAHIFMTAADIAGENAEFV